MVWFMFSDAYAGGKRKTPYEHILVEAGSETEAVETVEERYDVLPYGSSCPYDCCDDNFRIEQALTLDQLTASVRHFGLTAYDTPVSVKDFLARDDVDVVPAKQPATSTT